MYNNISKIISHIFNLIKLSKSYQNLMNFAVLLLPVPFGRCAVHGSSVLASDVALVFSVTGTGDFVGVLSCRRMLTTRVMYVHLSMTRHRYW